MGKRYLVTGAAGFIGSAIAKKLINDNEIFLSLRLLKIKQKILRYIN